MEQSIGYNYHTEPYISAIFDLEIGGASPFDFGRIRDKALAKFSPMKQFC